MTDHNYRMREILDALGLCGRNDISVKQNARLPDFFETFRAVTSRVGEIKNLITSAEIMQALRSPGIKRKILFAAESYF